MLNKENIENIFGLSPMQLGMLVHYARHGDTTAYIEQFDFVMKGQIDLPCLQKAFDALIAKYSCLRTVFSYRKSDEPRQIILKNASVKIEQNSLLYCDAQQAQEHIELFKAADKRKGFDLSKNIPIRLSILENATDQFHLVITFHHIILDGWCLGSVFGDLFSFYDIFLNNLDQQQNATEPQQWQELHPYSEFIRWLGLRDQKTALAWWQSYLDDYSAEAGIPWFDMSPEQATSALPATHQFVLGHQLTAKIDALGKANQLTFGGIFQTAWGLLLQKFNNTDDVVFGSVVSGRPPELPGVENIVGLFINTLPLRVRAEANDDFIDLAKRVGAHIFAASAYEYVPLYEIEKISQRKGGLINHILAFENYPVAERMKQLNSEGAALQILDVHIEEQTNYDFNVIVNPGGETRVIFSYNAARFNSSLMTLLERSLLCLLNEITTSPELPVAQVSVCSAFDRNLILNRYNRATNKVKFSKTIPQLFAETVERFGDEIALMGATEQYTYRELQEKIMCLAQLLSQQGIQPGTAVAILLPRCPDVITSILAILYCGASYVPLDPETPVNRLMYILEDAEVAVVITNQTLAPVLSDNQNINQILIDALPSVADVNHSEFPKQVSMDSPVYVMYTSGSTGKPKGCVVTHQNIVRLVKNTHYATFNEHQTILSTSSPVFDASTFEYWGALLNGGILAIYSNNDILDPARLKQLIDDKQVTTCWFTSAFFNQLVDADITLFAPLQQVLIGGDVLSLSHTRQLLEAHPHINLINGYGPTENTTFSATYPIKQPASYRIPIGKPIDHSSCYVVDDQNNLLPPGAYGELCVGGQGISSGYLQRPELNAAAFIVNPFAASERLYRTGDIARWLPDGNLDLQGRKDFQHKIRGYRIELGEIETAFKQLPGVRDSIVCVIDKEAAGKQLHAWYISEAVNDEAHIRQLLAQRLPPYMVPTHIMRMDKFPLNLSGKIDRNKLPDITQSLEVKQEVVAPRDELEQLVLTTFKDVLGLTNHSMGVFDRYVDYGTNSLNMITINNRLKKVLNKDIALQLFFTSQSIAELASAITRSEAEDASAFAPLAPLTKQEVYPASDSQKRIVILGKLDAAGTSYNVPNVYRLEGCVDIHALNVAFKTLIARHESLRTSFVIDKGEIYQQIADEISFAINVVPLVDTENVDRQLGELIVPFDIAKAPLLRVSLLCDPAQVETSADAVSYLFVDFHHSIIDGVSLGILLRELQQLCDTPVQTLPDASVFYKEYSHWLHSFLGSEKAQQAKNYWLKNLAGELPTLNLPCDFQRPGYQSFDGAVTKFQLDHELTQGLKQTASQRGISLYCLMLAGLNILLAKLSGQQDIIIGTPVASRLHPDAENIVGMFVNTLPMRSNVRGDHSLTEFLQQVAQTTQDAIVNDSCQFNSLLDELALTRDTSRNPVFDVMFAWENMELELATLGAAKVSAEVLSRRMAKFDLDVICIEQDGCIYGLWEYATALFSEDTIIRFADMYEFLLRQIVEANPSTRIADLTLVNSDERELLLHQFNQPLQPIAASDSLISLFLQQAVRTPDQLALISIDQQTQPPVEIRWSYRELLEKAENVAYALLGNGVIKNDKIAIHAGRSAHYIVAILGILRAGCVYVPIDPRFPGERKDYILSDSEARFLLAPQALAEEAINGMQPLSIEALWAATSAAQHNIAFPEAASDDPCYIMYTSGTTGTPKGVVVKHKGVVRLVASPSLIEFHKEDRLLLTGAVGFDSVTWEIWHSLLSGLTLCTADDTILLNPKKLQQFCIEQQINVCWFTAGLFHEYVRTHLELFSAFRMIVTGGDIVSPKYANRLLNAYPKLQLFNGYGPTENTVFATLHKIELPVGIPIPIGKPVNNTRVYILDDQLALVPKKVKGQLCITGEGLAMGYLNNPEATAQKFIDCPFEPGQKMYLSGDVACWSHEGVIEFFGRNDSQIKLRGFRIELMEIENAFIAINGVEAAHVILRGEGSDKQIIAYVATHLPVDAQALRTQVAKALPDYMVPAAIVILEQMPLTHNGKIDRAALPEPEIKGQANLEEAKSNIEKILLETWKKTLQIESMGTTDNFFEMGGDSIRAIHIISELSERGLDLDIPTLFKYPTIQLLAPNVSGKQVLAEQGEVTGIAPLTPIQSWYAQGGINNGRRLNQSMCLFSRQLLAEQHVSSALESLVAHHDALRTKITNNGDVISQYFPPVSEATFGYKFIDARDADEDSLIYELGKEFQESLDLYQGDCIRLGHIRGRYGDYLLFVLHHFIEDGVSLRILQQDFVKAYQQLEKGELVNLGLKTDSYKAWANALTEFRHSPQLAQEHSWWQFMEGKKKNYLPRKETVCRRMMEMKYSQWTLEAALTQNLLTKAHAAFGTQTEDLLLSALGYTLGELFGSDQYVIDLEGHGRENIGQRLDLSRTVGWFTSLYPICLDVSVDRSIEDCLLGTRDLIRQTPNKGIGYGIVKYLEPAEWVTPRASDICFNYLGTIPTSDDTELRYVEKNIGSLWGEEYEASSPILINAIVINGQMNINLLSHPQEIDQDLLTTFGNALVKNIDRIVSTCLSSKIKSGVLPANEVFGEAALAPLQKLLLQNINIKKLGTFNATSIYESEQLLEFPYVKAAFNSVIEHHDALRIAFKSRGATYVQYNRRLTDGELLDCEEINKDMDAGQLRHVIARWLKRPFDLKRDPLVRVLLVNSQGRSTLCIMVSHMIFDIVSERIFINDFITVYKQLVNAESVLLPEKSDTYIRWCNKLNLHFMQIPQAIISFWIRYFEDSVKHGVNPERKSAFWVANKPQITHVTVLKSKIDKLMAILRPQLATETGSVISAHDILLSLLGMSLRLWKGREKTAFLMNTHGRQGHLLDMDVNRCVGLFMTVFPFVVDLNNKKDFLDIVKKIHHDLDSVSKNGIYFLALLSRYKDFFKSKMDGMIVFNYQGEIQEQQLLQRKTEDFVREGIIEPSKEVSAQNRLTLAVRTFNNDVIIEAQYNSTDFDSDSINELLAIYSNQIDSLLQHYSNKDNKDNKDNKNKEVLI